MLVGDRDADRRPIAKHIFDELSTEAILDSHRIEVEVRDGTIRLISQVESFAEKSAAERAAYQATGRRAMTTRLRIKRCRLASGDETWVSEVRKSLESSSNEVDRASDSAVRRMQRPALRMCTARSADEAVVKPV